MRPTRRLLLAFALLALLPLAAPATAQPYQRCFPETGQCIAGSIHAYWERNGGLAVFGFPITEQRLETIEGTWTGPVQWFERDRLEDHANEGKGVLAGRLGLDHLDQMGTPFQIGNKLTADPGCLAFPETRHQVCGIFASYWNSGGLERFGFPMTGEFTMQVEGKPYTVQYFERRRFELHPEIGSNAVLLGLLGREVLNARQGQPQPVTPRPPPPQPPVLQPPPPQPPPPSYNNCQADANANAAPNFPVQILNIDDDREVVTLKNVSGEAVNLDGWIMCSVRGNQRHDGIGGVLAPNEQRDFAYTGTGTIWSNNEDDPGALYNPQGQLISHWQL